MQISEETMFTRLADALTFRDIEFESEEFNRRFTVRGRRAVRDRVLRRSDDGTPRLRRGDGYAFEVVDDRLLCSCRRVAPAGMIHLLGTVKTFREQIPAVVSSLYPKG